MEVNPHGLYVAKDSPLEGDRRQEEYVPADGWAHDVVYREEIAAFRGAEAKIGIVGGNRSKMSPNCVGF